AIYLRDHHPLLVVLSELAERIGATSERGEQRAFADELERAAADDRVSLEGFLRRLDSRPSRTRHAAAWTAEKVGRLKLNGKLVGLPPPPREQPRAVVVPRAPRGRPCRRG